MEKLILFIALFAALATAIPQQDPFFLGGFPWEDEELSLMEMEKGTEDFEMTVALFAKEDAEIDQVELQIIGSYRECRRRCRYRKYCRALYPLCGYRAYLECGRRCL